MSLATAPLLNVIEALLTAPLKTALSRVADIVSGPTLAPTTLSRPRLNIHATSLHNLPASPSSGTPNPERNDNQALPERERVWQRTQLQLKADPDQPARFTLPPDSQGSQASQVLEVSIPPGRILHQGDDYLLQDKHIVLLIEPPKKLNVIMRGAPAAGYREKNLCQITLNLEILAADSLRADTLSHKALLVCLNTLAGVDQLDLDGASTLDSSLRLLKLRARPDQIERQALALGSGSEAVMAVRVVSKIIIHAELELHLIVGEYSETGRIRAVEIKRL
jgi:hypothetical protein